MKVFLTGATGYIGFNVALRLRSAGHEVWGLVRSQSKMNLLKQNEIHTVFGEMKNPDSYRKIAEEASLIIHCAVDYTKGHESMDKLTVNTILEAGKKGPQPKTFIYTSGVWDYGSSNGLIDETTPMNPVKNIAWRPGVVKSVLNSKDVKGLVIHSGDVFGKSGGLTGTWFSGASNNDLKVIGDGNNRWPMIHVDDLADAYFRLSESGLSGEDFNIADRSRYTVREIVEAIAKVSGYSGKIKYIPLEEARRDMGDYAPALALDQHVDARKAVRMLGWQPKFNGMVDEIETYYEAWKAYNNLK